MKKYKNYKYQYNLCSHTVWGSFDFGVVEATNMEEARNKATEKLEADIAAINEALKPIGQTINISLKDLEIIQLTNDSTVKSEFIEIQTDYVDYNGVTHLDGYKTGDDNEEGIVIGYFINGEVYWRDPEYQFDPYVKEVVQELKNL